MLFGAYSLLSESFGYLIWYLFVCIKQSSQNPNAYPQFHSSLNIVPNLLLSPSHPRNSTQHLAPTPLIPLQTDSPYYQARAQVYATSAGTLSPAQQAVCSSSVED